MLFFDNFWVFVVVTFIALTKEAVHVINLSIMQGEAIKIFRKHKGGDVWDK